MKKITKGLLGILGIAVFNVLINSGLASYHIWNYSSLVENGINVRNQRIRLYSETSLGQRGKEFGNKINSLVMQEEALSKQAEEELALKEKCKKRVLFDYSGN